MCHGPSDGSWHTRVADLMRRLIALRRAWRAAVSECACAILPLVITQIYLAWCGGVNPRASVRITERKDERAFMTSLQCADSARNSRFRNAPPGQPEPTRQEDGRGSGSPTTDGSRDVGALDAVRDINHFGHKIPGLITWSVLALMIVGVVTVPDVVLVFAQVVALYMLLRIVLIVAFYPVAMIRVGRAEARARSAAPAPEEQATRVHHVVIIPNYREPIDVLSRTLRALAVQENARQRLTIVLAMEQSEAGASAKAERLRAMFKGRFAHVLITFHPTDQPNEVPGKGSNQNWAAREARRELVDRLGMPLEDLTLTSCDADSVIHPGYFAELTRIFAADPQRHRRFWQAPMRYDNNIWQVSAPIRLVTYFLNGLQASELANPLALNLPQSTYTLSFKLADEAGYWDGAVIAEDWHMFLRCFFATGGRVRLRPVFLPTSGDAVDGESTWKALKVSYQQRLRHAWGCQDVGYILHQWNKPPKTPFAITLLYLSKVFHDHVFFSTGGLVVAAGSILVVTVHAVSVFLAPVVHILGPVMQAGNLVSGLGMAALGVSEHLRCRREACGWQPHSMLRDLVMWPLLPVIMLGTVGVPIVHAQTKLLLGSPLVYMATPKRNDLPAG